MSRMSLAVGVLVAVVSSAGARAELRPMNQTSAPSAANELETRSVMAEVAGHFEQALSFAEQAIKKDPSDPWAYYDRADALTALNQTDNAVAGFAEAERRFPQADLWGRSVAIWGQADALNRAGRCAEAAGAYQRYVALIQNADHDAAELAKRLSQSCVSRAAK